MGGGEREKWNCGLITAKDEMERVAETKTTAIELARPLQTLVLLTAGISGRNMPERRVRNRRKKLKL
jgi:hypothetical protein